MPGDPRWLILLIRLVNRIYFAVAGCLTHDMGTRHERIRKVCGPSRRLVAVVWLLWLVVVVSMAHLIVVVLHGPTC
jgi:hypothetical protein